MGRTKFSVALIGALFVLGRSLLAVEPISLTPILPAEAEFPSIVFSFGPGIAVYSGDEATLYSGGTVGYSLNAGALFQVGDSLPLYAGLDFGLDFWSFDSTAQTDRSAVGVQLLGSVVYLFKLTSFPKWTPSLGLSAGPNFYRVRARTTSSVDASVNTESDLHLYLEILLRPGVTYQFTDNFGVGGELKLGILNWSFIFLPQVKAVISL